MGATLSTVSAILKEVYEPKIRKQLDDSTVALKRIEKSTEGVESQVGGRYVTFPIKTRRNAGIGARNELEALPVPGQQGYAAARVGLKYLYGGVQLSGQTIELADKNYQAFASALDSEVDGLKTDLAKDQNRQVYGNGVGTIATITADAANSITVADTMYLQLGEMIDIYDATGVTLRVSNRSITAINTSTGVVTYDGADGSASIVATDIVVRTGSINREWTGFGKIISNTGTLYNIDPTVEPVWKSVVDSNAGVNRALSEGLMISLVDSIRANGGTTTAMFSNLGVRRAYWQLLVQQRQFTNTKEFAGGFSGLTFTTDQGEIPFVVDVDAPKNRVYFVNEKELTLYRESDWSWMDRDGSMWNRVEGFDAYNARLYQYSELGCHRRNSQGLLADITEG
jgi:hypothetical protein